MFKKKLAKGCSIVFIATLISLVPMELVAQTAPLALTQTPPLVITHVTVIDMIRPKPKTNMTVVVEGNRIKTITRAGRLRIPEDALVVDGRGKFLIPGLWDMHVHALRAERVNYFLTLFIANGVTGIRDMGTTAEGFAALPQLRHEIGSGTRTGPRIVAAGRILDGARPAVPDNSIPFASPDEARRLVRALKQGGADFIKVYDGVTRDSYFAIVDEAKRQNIPAAGHVPTPMTSFEASEAGQKSFEHLGNILRSCSTLAPSEIDEQTRKRLNPASKPNDPSAIPTRIAVRNGIELDTFSERKCRQLFARFARNKTWQVPTLIVKQSVAYVDSIMLRDDPRRKYIPRATLDSWRPENSFFLKYRTPESIEMRKRLYQKEVELVRAMHKAGVKFMAGSDIPGHYMYPGFSLHDELGLFVNAGFTNFEALLTATRNPAIYLKLSNELGTIQKGKLADLILLDGNPMKDIANTKRISAVIVNGRYLPKEALERMLAGIEQWAGEYALIASRLGRVARPRC